jgi:hypothetical protein
MKRIIILGTNHAVQYSSNDFKSVIGALVKQYESRTIVEEVDWYEQTRGHEVADENHLVWHGACPPETDDYADTGEKEQIASIRITNYGPISKQIKRERFMQERVVAAMVNYESGLLICGLAHAQSMAEKLISSGFDVTVYEWQWPVGGPIPHCSF